MLASIHWPCRRNAVIRSCSAGSFAILTLEPEDPRRHSGLRQIYYPLSVFFNLLLLLAFGH